MDLTELGIKLRLLHFGQDIHRLQALKEVLNSVVLSKMDTYWNEALIPSGLIPKNNSKIEEAFTLFRNSEVEEMNGLFAFTIRTSIFSTAYYKFEHELSFLSELIAKNSDTLEELNQSDHNGIVRAQRFLKDVHSYDFPDKTMEWCEIKNYNRVRNAIAHNGGVAKRKKLKNYIQNKPEISMDEVSKIKFSDSYLEESLNNFSSFMDKLENVLIDN